MPGLYRWKTSPDPSTQALREPRLHSLQRDRPHAIPLRRIRSVPLCGWNPCSRPAAPAELALQLLSPWSQPASSRSQSPDSLLLMSPSNLQVHAEHIRLVTHGDDGNVAG